MQIDRERVRRPAVIHTTQTIAFLTVDLRQGSGSHTNRRGRNSHERPRPYPGSMSEPDTSASPVHPLPHRVSELFDPARWREVEGFAHVTGAPAGLTDVTYHRGCARDADGAWLRDLPVVRVAFDRPEVRNAFRPRTVDELYRVLDHARMSGDVGAVVLTGNGPSPRDGGWAFSSGGDQRIRGRDGYRYEREDAVEPAGASPACSPPVAVAHTETVGCASSSLAKTVRTSGSSSTIMTLTGTMGPSVMRASFLMSRGRRPRHQIVPRGRSQSGSCTRILG